jgi:hypothetical protein
MKRRYLLSMILAILPLGAAAQDAALQTPLRDPWVPPAVRKAAPQTPSAPPTHGAALQAQVEAKLKAGFDAADVEKSGTISREQARAAGLGYIANNFAAIDASRTGRVSFDDVKRYLRRNGAAL